jgi:hypothetical protein
MHARPVRPAIREVPMSVLRPSGLLIVLVLALAAVAACGSSASPSTSASVAAGATPVPASQPAEPTDVPTDGGGPAFSIPPIVDAQYTTGKLHAEISGDVTTTLDAPLQGGLSFTSGDSTVLSYADATGSNGGGIVIGGGILGVTIATKELSTAGSTGDSNHCDVSLSQSDASRLAGTFDCKRLIGVVPDGSRNVTVDMKGTFEASR